MGCRRAYRGVHLGSWVAGRHRWDGSWSRLNVGEPDWPIRSVDAVGRPPPHPRGARGSTATRPGETCPTSSARSRPPTSWQQRTPTTTSAGRCRWTPRSSGSTNAPPEHAIGATLSVCPASACPQAARAGRESSPSPSWPTGPTHPAPSAGTCDAGESARSSRRPPARSATAYGEAGKVAARPHSTARPTSSGTPSNGASTAVARPGRANRQTHHRLSGRTPHCGHPHVDPTLTKETESAGRPTGALIAVLQVGGSDAASRPGPPQAAPARCLWPCWPDRSQVVRSWTRCCGRAWVLEPDRRPDHAAPAQ